MDTSNSQKDGLVDTAEPTVSVVDYLLASSEQRITTTDVPLETWVIAVRRLIEQCKPYLKYFHGFKELGEKINRDWWEQIAFESEGRTITFPEGVTNKTRVMHIEKFGDGLHAWWDGDIFVSYQLLLTDKGMMVLGTLKREKTKGLYASGTNRAKIVEFEEVDDDKLAHLIFESHGRITDLAKSLQEVLTEGIKRREEQLESLRGILTTVTRFDNLLDLKVICKKCTGSKDRFGNCPNCEKSSE